MKSPKFIKIASIATSIAILLGTVIFASRELGIKNVLDLFSGTSSKQTTDNLLVKELDEALVPAKAERNRLKARVEAQKEIADQLRKSIKASLDSCDSEERAKIVEILRADELPESYRDRVDVAQMLVNFRAGLKADRELTGLRNSLKALDAQIALAVEERNAAERRAKVNELLERSAETEETSTDVSEHIDRLVALTDEAANKSVSDAVAASAIERDELEPNDLLKDDNAEKTTYLENLDKSSNDDVDDETTTSEPKRSRFASILQKDRTSKALGIVFVFGATVVAILVVGLCFLFKTTSQLPSTPSTNASIPAPQGQSSFFNGRFVFLIGAILVGSVFAGPLGAAFGLIVGAFVWQWRFGVRLLGVFGAVAVALLAAVVLFVLALCALFV